MRIPPHAKYEIIYEMTKQNGNRLSVSTLCEIAGVSRSGYYNYLSTEDVRLKREEQDRKDFQKILEAYSFRGYNKGARSIYMRLLHMDPPIHMNVKKIRRLMKKMDCSALSGRQIRIGEWLRLWQQTTLPRTLSTVSLRSMAPEKYF